MVPQWSHTSSCPPSEAVRHWRILCNAFVCSGDSLSCSIKLLPNFLTTSASSYLLLEPAIQSIEWTMWFYMFTLSNMQIYHSSSNLCMTEEFFQGYNIESLLE